MKIPLGTVRLRPHTRPPGCQLWYPIKTSLLSNPLEEADWRRLAELKIDVIGDKQLRAGVAFNHVEFRKLLEEIVGKKAAVMPYNLAERREREGAATPSLRHSIHYNEDTGEETKDPAKIYGPTAAQPLNLGAEQ